MGSTFVLLQFMVKNKHPRNVGVTFAVIRYVHPSQLPTKPLQVAAKKVFVVMHENDFRDLEPIDWFLTGEQVELFFDENDEKPLTNFEQRLVMWLIENGCSLYLYEW